jgi:CheY-like chemotaxis protein
MSDDPEVAEWTVLVVDDETDNLGVSEGVLSYFGASVHTAEDGTMCLKVLETLRPTFILLDLSMPMMDGWEAFKLIREKPELAETPVIALTAHAMAGDREKVIEAGFSGYISKPIMIDTFVEDIKACLKAAV